MLNVQFSDSTEATIISWFAMSQNPSVWPNLGAVATSDARWATYYNAQAASVQALLPAPA